MSAFERALKGIEVPEDMPDEKEWSAFVRDDPYNPGNSIEGYLCRTATRFYGALLLTFVNGKEMPQLIFCTPKLHYPFDKNENWHFPKAMRIEVYEKLDGTNIFAYTYRAPGCVCQSFKTRQTPVVEDTELIPFKSLLLEVLDRKATFRFWQETSRNLSFELWGAKNPHLIQYQRPLALSFLFSVDSRGEIYSPKSGNWTGEIPKDMGRVDGNYVETYRWHQSEDESALKPLEDGGFEGSEGRVWYLLTEGMKWVMFKCKPHQIEKIHWTTGGIGVNIIKATALNSLESGPMTVDTVIELLKEEFTEQQIAKSQIRIGNVIEEVKANLAFRDRVLALYDVNGIDINSDKAGALRALSPMFEKREMKRVYSSLIAYRGISR